MISALFVLFTRHPIEFNNKFRVQLRAAAEEGPGMVFCLGFYADAHDRPQHMSAYYVDQRYAYVLEMGQDKVT